MAEVLDLIAKHWAMGCASLVLLVSLYGGLWGMGIIPWPRS